MKKPVKQFDLSDVFATKTFRIIFSIVVAVALWIYVARTQNNDISYQVRNVPVQFESEDTLADADLILTDVDADSVTLNFTGKRNSVTKLNSANIIVTVDLAEITRQGRAGIYQLPYEITYPAGVNSANVNLSASTAYITATVERLVTKTVEITGVNRCSIAQGYQSEQMDIQPGVVTVSGTEALVGKVDHCQVTLDKKDVDRTVSESVEIALVGRDGSVIEDEGLSLSQSTAFVTLPVVMVKEVGLKVNLVYGNSASESNVVCTVTPSTVTISGDAEELDDINQLVLGTIDLTSFATTTTETMSIPIPNEVRNVSGETTASVQVEVLDMSTSRVSATNIYWRNAPMGHTVNIITQSLDVLLRGDDDILSEITGDNIRIIADLSEAGGSTGTMSVSAKVYIDGYSDVDAIGSYRVSVAIG